MQKNFQSHEEGSYTMLLSILIAFFLICLFIFRQDIFTGKRKEQNIFKKGNSAIEQAKQVTHTQDNHTHAINEMIDN